MRSSGSLLELGGMGSVKVAMKVSIITVVFNGAQTIEDAIRSVAEQETVHEIEHIIIDGGSTDGTMEVVLSYESTIAKVVSESDEGIYDAMNKGLRFATGEVVGFLNSDDLLSDSSVIERVGAVFKDPYIEACYGDLSYVDKTLGSVVRYWRAGNFRLGSFRLGWCPPHPTFYARRSVYERFGGFNLQYRIASDVDLMMRFLEVHRVRCEYIPQLLVKMRVGGVSNRGVGSLWVVNREIWTGLARNGLHPSLIPFVFGKVFHRAGQFLAAAAANFRRRYAS